MHRERRTNEAAAAALSLMLKLKATTTAKIEGTTSHILIWERHHGTLGPIATLTNIACWESYCLLSGILLGCYTVLTYWCLLWIMHESRMWSMMAGMGLWHIGDIEVGHIMGSILFANHKANGVVTNIGLSS